MEYTIHRFVRERWVREDTIKGRAADWVYEHAKQIVESRQADRVEVVDQRNVLVFRWPRVLHRA
jgi:hypothetical protein